jgi:hypothetical protein
VADYDIPHALKNKVTRVTDNMSTGDVIVVEPMAFISVFRSEIEQWLQDKAEQKQLAR